MLLHNRPALLDALQHCWLVTATCREQRLLLDGSHAGQAALPPGQSTDCTRLLLRTGMGAASVRQHLPGWLADSACGGLLSIGYCGGLQDGLPAGQLLLYRYCTAEPSPGCQVCWQSADEALVGALAALLDAHGIAYMDALALCTARVVCSGSDKKQLGRRFGAQAVDMESAEIFHQASRRGLPCAALRVVLDPVELDLPELRPPRWRSILRPDRWWRLYRSERAASRVLRQLGQMLMPEKPCRNLAVHRRM